MADERSSAHSSFDETYLESKMTTSQIIDRDKLKPYFFLAIVVAVLLLVASVGGLFVKSVYAQIMPADRLPAAYGQDLLSLLVVPALGVSLYFAVRGSARGLIALAGILGYVAYAYALYAFEGLYSVLFPVYVALLGLSVYALAGILTNINGERYRSYIGERMPERAISLYLLSVDVLIVPIWLWIIVKTISTGELSTGFNTVYVLDLAVLLPAFLVGAILLWRRISGGYILSGVLLIKAMTLGLSIVFGYVFQIVSGLAVSLGRGGLYLMLTIVGGILTIAYLRNLKKPIDVVYISD